MKLSKKELFAATGVAALLLGLFAPTAQVFVTGVMKAAINAAPRCDADKGVVDNCIEE